PDELPADDDDGDCGTDREDHALARLPAQKPFLHRCAPASTSSTRAVPPVTDRMATSPNTPERRASVLKASSPDASSPTSSMIIRPPVYRSSAMRLSGERASAIAVSEARKLPPLRAMPASPSRWRTIRSQLSTGAENSAWQICVSVTSSACFC